MSITALPAWQALATQAKVINQQPLANQLNGTDRNRQLQLKLGDCYFDFSKQRVDLAVLAQLTELAKATDIAGKARQMLQGAEINTSEKRAVLHTALRGGAAPDPTIDAAVEEVQQRMLKLAEQIRSGTWRGCSGKAITDVVHIGIGGSHLGPELAVTALRDHHNSHLRLHFLANIDANNLHRCLVGLNPETTLFIVASKSFGTLETKLNAISARSWFIERTKALDELSRHFIGVTSNVPAAIEFGLAEENLLPMWDWVGGRYSLWSAVGLPVLLAVGEDKFLEFLEGARLVDEHFSKQPPATNIPMLSALLATWNYNFLGAGSLAVLSYDERLALLPDYLQQLEMESNGKSVTIEGQPVDYHTMPILWGGVGTNGQHAYHQLLHQGTRAFSADFITVAQDDRRMSNHHDWLLANALGQSQAMAVGYQANATEPHREVPGNHPSTTIVLDSVSPAALGTLLAVYEHKVFCQGAIWNINSFDQWGVELGKQLAVPIYEQLAEGAFGQSQDAATQDLIDYLRSK
ncbi:MAG: glucose-6-phosphate isomerase [Pseudomonadota bacterium]